MTENCELSDGVRNGIKEQKTMIQKNKLKIQFIFWMASKITWMNGGIIEAYYSSAGKLCTIQWTDFFSFMLYNRVLSSVAF